MILITTNPEMEKEIKRMLQTDFFQEIKAEVHEGTDTLGVFCKNEAEFRLREFFFTNGRDAARITPEMTVRVAEIIRNVLDNSEALYDEIDSDIQNFLEEEFEEEYNPHY